MCTQVHTHQMVDCLASIHRSPFSLWPILVLVKYSTSLQKNVCSSLGSRVESNRRGSIPITDVLGMSTALGFRTGKEVGAEQWTRRLLRKSFSLKGRSWRTAIFIQCLMHLQLPRIPGRKSPCTEDEWLRTPRYKGNTIDAVSLSRKTVLYHHEAVPPLQKTLERKL